VQGSQKERADLEKILAHADTIDVVIDDCSHLAEPTRLAFDTLFPHVRPGGFYVVEDWGTGYWPSWPDGKLPQSRNHLAGMVGLVKEFVDVVGIPAINCLLDPPSIHEANQSSKNSPYEYVIYFPGMACVKKALPPGEPDHSPLARKEPSVGPQRIDVKRSPSLWTSVLRRGRRQLGLFLQLVRKLQRKLGRFTNRFRS